MNYYVYVGKTVNIYVYIIIYTVQWVLKHLYYTTTIKLYTISTKCVWTKIKTTEKTANETNFSLVLNPFSTYSVRGKYTH